MSYTHKFKINDEAVFISKRKDLISKNGDKVQIASVLPLSSANDYEIKFEDGTLLKASENELQSLKKEYQDMPIKKFSKVLVLPKKELGKVIKIDYLYGQAEVYFEEENISRVFWLDKLILAKDSHDDNNNYIHTLKDSKQEYILNTYLKHYENTDETYTLPKQLLINIINSTYGE